MAIDLGQFEVISSVFELRYRDNPLLWDQIGSFWYDIFQGYPDAAIKSGEPNRTVVQLSPNIQGAVELNSARLAAQRPGSNLDELRPVAKLFVSHLRENLNIEVFTRIGLRTSYLKDFHDKESAADYVISHCGLAPPSGKQFNIEGRVLNPELGWRWEGDVSGCTIKIVARKMQLNAEFPPEFSHLNPQPSQLTKQQVLVDVDYYIHAQTDAAMIDGDDLIGSWSKAVRRDIRSMKFV